MATDRGDVSATGTGPDRSDRASKTIDPSSGAHGVVGVVVVNYGSSALIERNLPASTTADDVVVVVDNWSTASERDALRRLAEQHGWHLETPDENGGFGRGMNAGVARALAEGASSLLLLNPDAHLAPQDRARLIEQVEQNPDLLLAPRIIAPDGSAVDDGRDGPASVRWDGEVQPSPCTR